jgi:hypothetical protein
MKEPGKLAASVPFAHEPFPRCSSLDRLTVGQMGSLLSAWRGNAQRNGSGFLQAALSHPSWRLMEVIFTYLEWLLVKYSSNAFQRFTPCPKW